MKIQNDTQVRAGGMIFALVLTMSVFLSGCGGGGASGTGSGTASVGGTATKGPFQIGALVGFVKLDDAGNPTTTMSSTTVTDNLGGYSTASIDWTGPTLVRVSGNYIDLATGGIRQGAIEAVFDASGAGEQVINVTAASHLAAARIRRLLAAGQKFSDARVQADTEVLREVVALVGGDVNAIPPGTRISDLNPLDGDSASAGLNAALLSFDLSLDAAAGDDIDGFLGAMATDMLDGVRHGDQRTFDDREPFAIITPRSSLTPAARVLALGSRALPGMADLMALVPPAASASGNTAPVAIVPGVVSPTGSVTITVVDPDSGDTPEFAVASQGRNGVFSVDAGGVVVYTPAAGSGSQADSAEITVSDGNNGTTTVRVLYTPGPPTNAVPTARAGAATVEQGKSIAIDLNRFSADRDTGNPAINDARAAVLFDIAAVQGGTATLDGNGIVTFTAQAAVGTGQFSFRRRDLAGGVSAIQRIIVDITATAAPVTAQTVEYTVSYRGNVTQTLGAVELVLSWDGSKMSPADASRVCTDQPGSQFSRQGVTASGMTRYGLLYPYGLDNATALVNCRFQLSGNASAAPPALQLAGSRVRDINGVVLGTAADIFDVSTR